MKQVLVLLACICSISLFAQTAEEYNEQGNTLYDKDDYTGAIPFYTKAIAADPTYKWAYVNRGNCYKELKEYPKALIDYGAAIKIDPAYVNAYYYRGETYYWQDDYTKAIDDLTKAIDLGCKKAGCFFYRGDCYYYKDDYDKALIDYDKAVELDPEYNRAYNKRGLIFKDRKEYDKAIKEFTQAIVINPDYSRYYTSRGDCYYNKEDYDMSIIDYTKAISLEKDYVYAWHSRGIAYEKKKRYNNAIADFTKAVELDPTYKYSWASRGNVRAEIKEYDSAHADFDRAIVLDNKYSYAFYRKGHTYKKQTEYRKAIETFNGLLKFRTDYYWGYNSRGECYNELSEYENAVKDYTLALKYNTDNDNDAFINRGIAYDNWGKYDSAITDYGEAINIDPTCYICFYNRAIAYKNKGEYDKSLVDYNTCLQMSPNLSALNNRGVLLKAMGEYKGAVADCKTILTIDENYSKAYINMMEPLARLYEFKEAKKYYDEFTVRKLSSYLDYDEWAFLKKYIEVITLHLSKDDYKAAYDGLTEATQLYEEGKDKRTGEQKNSFSSLLALTGYVLEKLERRDEALAAYQQALILNPYQKEVVASVSRLNKKKQVLVKDDATPPEIVIIEPKDNKAAIGTNTTEGMITIKGRVVDESGVKTLRLNNTNLQAEEDGYFEAQVKIRPGNNTFIIAAVDGNANLTTHSLEITAETRSISIPTAGTKPPEINTKTKYYAILIAEADYKDNSIKDLPTTVHDLRMMYHLLTENYTFDPKNVDTLVNASRVDILETVMQRSNSLDENANLLIFYAGHGQMIKRANGEEEGFLVPADARKDKEYTYLSSEDLKTALKQSKAKHILLLADACFSGAFTRNIENNKAVPAAVQMVYKNTSRRIMASGNREEVPAESLFIEYFKLSLQENRNNYVSAEQLFDSFKSEYVRKTSLSPQYAPIFGVGDRGGHFVFVKRN
jgi:tetratricopeptide (TPR) repeat protein